MSENEIKDIFLNEAKEILSNVESDLVLLEEGGDADLLNRIFRAAHTLKGSSAIAGYADVSGFMHGLESVLERLRTGELAADDRLTDLLLKSFDWVRLALFGDGSETDLAATRDNITKLMLRYTAAPDERSEKAETAHKEVGYWCYRVRAKFREDIFESGIDPLSIMDDFTSLGQVVELKADDTALPAFEALDPEKCYLAWDATIKTKYPREKVEEVLLFVKDDNGIELEDGTARYIKESDNERSTEDKKVGEILMCKGILTKEELDNVLSIQNSTNQ